MASTIACCLAKKLINVPRGPSHAIGTNAGCKWANCK